MRTWHYEINRSDLISEEDKLKENYLIANIDYNIRTLVYEKTELHKAYNYYNGKRDREQFRALEEQYGIGNAINVEFTPLIKTHIDVLAGQLLATRINPKITCKDEKTLSLIHEEKSQEFIKKILSDLETQYKKARESIFKQYEFKDTLTEDYIKDQLHELNKSFQSKYEIAAQHIINYFKNSISTDYENKLRTLFIDLLVAGQCYYRVKINNIGEDPEFEVLNPLDTFFNKPINLAYLKETNRVVHRTYITRSEALNRFGHLMSEEDKQRLVGRDILTGSGEAKFFRTFDRIDGNTMFTNTGTTVDQQRVYSYMNEETVVLYYTEWLANNEVEIDDDTYETQDDLFQHINEDKIPRKIKRHRLDRYEGYRLGTDIYFGYGKSKNVIRSVSKPYDCDLSINGVAYSDRNGTPYSIVLSTAHLQDKFDLLLFMRDNIIANSGVKGDFLDVTMLPTFLGNSMPERIIKWKAYKKQGTALIDSTQEGSNLNTIFGGFDDTLNAQSIEAINYTLQSIEQTASRITGVSAQMLGNIEQREAVSNVRYGVQQSSLITKQFFFLINQMIKHSLTDLLNLSKISWKKGKKGSYILGSRREFFTLEPSSYSFTDYDIHVTDGEFEFKDAETIKQFALELAKSGQVETDTIIKLITAQSLTDIKETVLTDLEASKAKQIAELQKAYEELQKQNQEISKQAQELQKRVSDYDQAKLQLEKQRQMDTAKYQMESIRLQDEANKAKAEEMRNRTELEKLQAQYNPTNSDNEIVNL